MAAPTKEDAEALALRARPRPVARLNRRTLVAIAAILGVAVLAATMWGLRAGRGHKAGERSFTPSIGWPRQRAWQRSRRTIPSWVRLWGSSADPLSVRSTRAIYL